MRDHCGTWLGQEQYHRWWTDAEYRFWQKNWNNPIKIAWRKKILVLSDKTSVRAFRCSHSCNILLLKIIESICLKIFARLPLNIDNQFRRPTVLIQMRRKAGQSFRAPSAISREAVPLICWNPCGFRAPRRVSSPSAPSRPPPQPALEMCLRNLGALPELSCTIGKTGGTASMGGYLRRDCQTMQTMRRNMSEVRRPGANPSLCGRQEKSQKQTNIWKILLVIVIRRVQNFKRNVLLYPSIPWPLVIFFPENLDSYIHLITM